MGTLRVSLCRRGLRRLTLAAAAACLLCAAAAAAAAGAAATPPAAPTATATAAATAVAAAAADAADEEQRGPKEEGGELPCTTGFRDAINAAIAELLEEHVVANELLQSYKSVPYVPLLGCPPYGGSFDTRYWPSLSAVHWSDILHEVLSTGILRIASYGPPAPPSKPHPDGPHRAWQGYDWGVEGNYTAFPYTGFFPQYVEQLTQALGVRYKKAVSPQWQFYTSGAACLQAVLRGEAHMTDVYFLQAVPEDEALIASLTPPEQQQPAAAAAAAAAGTVTAGGRGGLGGSLQRLFLRTCPVIAASHMFVTRDSVRASTLHELNVYIRSQEARLPVGYLTPANYKAVHFLLPFNTPAEILSRSEALKRVEEGTLLGVAMTGSLSPSEARGGLHAIPMRIFSAMGPWIKRTDTPRCLSHRFQRDLVQQEGSAAAVAAAAASLEKAAAAANAAAGGLHAAAAVVAVAGSLLTSCL